MADISVDQIKKLAALWYRALDLHVPNEEICQYVADPDVEMVFPEKTLHGMNNFVAWYSGGTYSDGEKTKGVINIFFDENHNVVSVEPTINGDTADVKVIVAWQASWFDGPATKSKRTSLDAIQTWKVRRSTKNPYGLEITSYNAVAEPFKYAPGFARL